MSRSTHGRVVLGLCAFTHDSAAALIVDGTLIGFVEEERLTGDKHTKAYPAKAVAWLLDEADLVPEQVDVVAYNYDGRRYLDAVLQMPGHLCDGATRARALARARSFVNVYRLYRQRMRLLKTLFPSAQLIPVLHHRAHGMYAFGSSGYDSAAVLVIDSLGEMQTTTMAHAASPGDYRVVREVTDPVSLGYVYGAVTEHLGWPRGDGEGTVMALAALGDLGRFRPLFEQAIQMTSDGFTLDPCLFPLRVISSRYPRTSSAFARATCPPRQRHEPIEAVHADLAAAVQERTEQVVVHLAARARSLTGTGHLCVAGGVAMNCVAIGQTADSGLFDEIHVPPSPGDGGTAIGAALAAHLDLTGRIPAGIEDRCYLGPSYHGLDLPTVPRPGLSSRRLSDPAVTVAQALAAGHIVGLFQGQVEAGPRALGNRSILASPTLPDVVERLNTTVKRREPFRPFAPVALADKATDYFTLSQAVPYMSLAVRATELAVEQVPSVVHTNGTARVQTVTPQQNPLLASILREFAEMTGVPALINTSLNVKGQPICGTPTMALDCLASTGLDALLIEDWWITK